MVAPRICDFGPLVAARPYSRVELAAEKRRLKVTADVPESGALWHRMGSDRRGHVVLRLRAAICDSAQAVARPAHRLAPARARQTDLDDQREHQSTTARAASRQLERCKQGRASAHLHGQTQQRLDGPRVRSYLP